MAKTAAREEAATGRPSAKAEAPAGQPAKKRNWKKLVVLLSAVMVLAGLGGGSLYLLKKRQATDEQAGAKELLPKKVRQDGPPIFVRLEAFTVKLQPDSEKPEQYLQAVPELRVLDASVGDRVRLYMPEIRHRTLLLMSGKRPSDISTPQGMDQLAFELRDEVNRILDGGPPRPEGAPLNADPEDPTQAVLFTAFIIQ